MSKKEKIILSISPSKIEDFTQYGKSHELELTPNMAIVHLASMKLNELNEAKKV